MVMLVRGTMAGLAAALLTVSQAQAISRVNTTNKSCQAVRDQVAREGAVILRHPAKRTRGITLYDRYVANARYCTFDEITQRAYVPTRDNANCPVLKCVRPDPQDDFLLWPLNRRHR